MAAPDHQSTHFGLHKTEIFDCRVDLLRVRQPCCRPSIVGSAPPRPSSHRAPKPEHHNRTTPETCGSDESGISMLTSQRILQWLSRDLSQRVGFVEYEEAAKDGVTKQAEEDKGVVLTSLETAWFRRLRLVYPKWLPSDLNQGSGRGVRRSNEASERRRRRKSCCQPPGSLECHGGTHMSTNGFAICNECISTSFPKTPQRLLHLKHYHVDS